MRTIFLPRAEVVRRLDALSLLAPMRVGFRAHSGAHTRARHGGPPPSGAARRLAGVDAAREDPELPRLELEATRRE